MTDLDTFSRDDFLSGSEDRDALAIIRMIGGRLAHTPSKIKRCAWFSEFVSDRRSEEFLVEAFIDMYRNEKVYMEYGGPLDTTTIRKLNNTLRVISSAHGWGHIIAPKDDFLELVRVKLLNEHKPKRPPRPIKSKHGHESRFIARFRI